MDLARRTVKVAAKLAGCGDICTRQTNVDAKVSAPLFDKLRERRNVYRSMHSRRVISSDNKNEAAAPTGCYCSHIFIAAVSACV